jgi:16S rRNA (guanine527-N7)-methyltransferase
MKRTSNSRTPRGDAGGSRRGEARGPRAGGSAGPQRPFRSRDERSARGRDERAPRGGGSRPAASGSRFDRAPRDEGARTDARRGARGTGERSAAKSPTQRSSPRPSNPDVLVARQPWAGLRPLLPGSVTEVESRLGALKTYAKQLLEWNRGVSNLISRNDEPRIVDRHLRESIFPARLLLESGCRRFVDLGSGAGLPAVPLALCGVGEHWTLVESRRNKTLFLRKIKQDYGLKNFDVRTNRLEVLVQESAAELACDGFTSRATMTIGPTLELAAQIVSPGGKAFLWKGSSYEQEAESTRPSWEAAWRLESVLPIADGPNVVAVFVRL